MGKIKEFFIANSTQFRKFWVNQIAISLLGIMITLPMLTLEKNHPDLGTWPELLAAVFCGGMFCFLIYDMTYALGAKDYIRVHHQNAEPDKNRALKICVLAYAPTILVTLCAVIFFVLGRIIPDTFGNPYAVTSIIMNMAIHAMYSGLFFYLPESFNVIAFPIGIIITVFFGWLGYYMSTHDKSLRSVFGIKTKPYRE